MEQITKMLVPNYKPITDKRLRQLESERNTKRYREWKETVLSRDEYKCQYPGCDKTNKLQVHHIRRFAVARHLRTEPFNGITLCKDHHDKVTGYETVYEEMFWKLIHQKYYADEK